MKKAELSEQMERLSPRWRQIVEECCKERDNILDRAGHISGKLDNMIKKLTTVVIPSPSLPEGGRRGAIQIKELCSEAESIITELVRELAKSDSIIQVLMRADPAPDTEQ